MLFLSTRDLHALYNGPIVEADLKVTADDWSPTWLRQLSTGIFKQAFSVSYFSSDWTTFRQVSDLLLVLSFRDIERQW